MVKQDNFDQILHFFAKKIYVVVSKMCPQKFAPLELIVGVAHGYGMVSGAAPSGPQRTMRNAKRIHICLQNSPTMFCTPTANPFLLLDAASH